MSLDNSYRLREEEKAVKAEKRPIRTGPYPEVGRWNKKTDTIEYPGYSEHTLEQIGADPINRFPSTQSTYLAKAKNDG